MRRWLSLLLLAVLAGDPASAGAVLLPGVHQTVLINLTGGLPGRWDTCGALCAPGQVQDTLLGPGPDATRLAWRVRGDPESTRALEFLEYRYVVRRADGVTTVTLVSEKPYAGIHLVQQYRLDATSRLLSASLQLPAGAELELRAGAALAGPQLPGFGSLYTDARAISVSADGQVTLAEEGSSLSGQLLPAGQWIGLRSRFRAILLQAKDPLRFDAGETVPEQPVIAVGRSNGAPGTLELRIYGGPVAAAPLAAAAPELQGMLYASLWNWLRALASGLRLILQWWQGLVGNWGVAIMLLSLSVKVLMWPLTAVAERWQSAVNRTQTLLQPELEAIRREFRGEEAHRLTLEVYRKHGVSQFYPVKSLAGFLIQIPVFIAAFDMLGENFDLQGATFLWISDLSLSDHFLHLPGTLPFFGAYLNLLPVLMTVLTVLAARLQEDPALSPQLLARQRARLYVMAGLFFVLLYTFPAGMVLYWTTNNLLHLLKILLLRVAGRRLSGGQGQEITAPGDPVRD